MADPGGRQGLVGLCEGFGFRVVAAAGVEREAVLVGDLDVPFAECPFGLGGGAAFVVGREVPDVLGAVAVGHGGGVIDPAEDVAAGAVDANVRERLGVAPFVVAGAAEWPPVVLAVGVVAARDAGGEDGADAPVDDFVAGVDDVRDVDGLVRQGRGAFLDAVPDGAAGFGQGVHRGKFVSGRVIVGSDVVGRVGGHRVLSFAIEAS